ncbi:MAG: hypothetical protein WCO51_11445 [bacterium]
MSKQSFWKFTAGITLAGFVSVNTAGCVSFKSDGPRDAAAAIKQYESSRRPAYDKSITAAVAYYQEYQHDKSFAAACRALESAGNEIERAFACACASQALGAMGRFQEAGEFATKGQRFDPTSAFLASLRLAFFKKAGDKLQIAAADDALRQLDPQYAKKPVFLIEGCLIVVGAYLIYAIYAHEKVSKSSSEEEKIIHSKVATQMLAIGGTVATGLLALALHSSVPGQKGGAAQ